MKRQIAPTRLRGGTQAEPVAVGKPRINVRRAPIGALARQSCGNIPHLALRPDDQAAKARIDTQRPVGDRGLPRTALAEIVDPVRQIEARAVQIDVPATLSS